MRQQEHGSRRRDKLTLVARAASRSVDEATPRRVRRWRQAFAPALVLVLAGCGGGDAGSGPPGNPTPTPPGPPSSLQVQAGDNQQGEPGQPLATRPAVVVFDASGRAVPGVAVTFAVDSGGGRVSVANISTGADGSASPGDWTLGSAEGRHVLSASTGSLAPAKLVATAKLRPTTVSTESIGSGGGSITVTTSGPLTGLKLEVPAGALPEPVSISVGYSSAIGIPLDTVARVASVLVTLETDAVNAANELFSIKIPAKLAADEIPTVIVVDPIIGFIRALSTVRFDSTSATAELGTLALQPDFPALAAARPVGTPTSAGATLPAGPKTHLLVVAAKQQQMSKSLDVLFRPGADDWDFARQDTPVGPTAFGQVATADYIFRKGGSSQKLWDRFDLAKGIPTSNTLGISWTAGFSARVNAQVQRHMVAAAARRAQNPTLYDVIAEMNLFIAMALSGKPQVVVMVLPGNLARPVLAYKWAGSLRQISVANPLLPGDVTRLLSLTTGGLDCGGPCFAVLGLNYFDQVLASDWTNVQAGTSQYGSAFPRAFGHISSGAVWTTGNKVDTVWMVRDTASIWTAMPSWPHQLPDPAPGATKTQYQEVYYEKGSWASSQSGSSSSAHQLDVQALRTPSTAPGVDIAIGVEARAVWPPVGNVAATKWAGFALYRVIKYNPTVTGVYGPLGGQTDLTVANGGGPALPGNFVYVIEWGDGQKQVYQTVPRTINHNYADHQARTARLLIVHPTTRDTVARTSLKLEDLSITPNPHTGTSDTDYTFTATYAKATPSNPSWVWDLGDGRKVTTQTNTASLRWPADPQNLTRQLTMTVTLKSGNAIVATGIADVTIKTPVLRWLITSFNEISATSTLHAPPANPFSLERTYRETEMELRDSLLARPSGGIIEVYGPGKAPQAWYRHFTENPILFPWLLAFREQASSTSMYLRYPRGAQWLGGLLGATGAPLVIPPFGSINAPHNSTGWTNDFSQSSAIPVRYLGKGATKALGSRTVNTTQPSFIMMHMEVDATTTATGIAGTITYVATIICSEESSYVTKFGCGTPVRGKLTRVYQFAAITDPGTVAPAPPP